MSTRSPSEVVTAFIEAIERQDIEAAAALAAPDISYENMPIDPIVGREAMAATLAMFIDAASDVEWHILTQFEYGDTVANERLDRFRIGDGWLELPVAGFFRVGDDGLISLWRDYFDMGTYQHQMAELTS